MDAEDKKPGYFSNNAVLLESSDEISSAVSTVASEVSLDLEYKEISIYDVYTKCQRNVLTVFLIVIAFLLPFSDTIYLPALNEIAIDLNTSYTLVGISVAIYLFISGIASLVWGCASDRFGRKPTIIVALIIFIIASIVCIFAPNIVVLIIFRGIQGGATAATAVIGQALIADVVPEEKRGLASAFFYVPYNAGAVLGPLVGGPLAGAFGWRSTFILLSILSFCILIYIIIAVPETHQYLVKVKFQKAHPNKRVINVDIDAMPPFEKPWKPLVYLGDLTILPYMLVMSVTFATLYAALVLLPSYLHASPYNYSPSIIGILFVPLGVSMFVSNLIGGWLSDLAAKRYESIKWLEGRLLPATILSIICPIGLMIFGWTFQYKLNVAGPIMGGVLFSFGQAVLEPSVSSYLTVKKQQEAAIISAANAFLNLLLAGIFASTATPLRLAMRTGPYFSLLFALNTIAILIAIIPIYKSQRRARVLTQQNSDETIGLIKAEPEK